MGNQLEAGTVDLGDGLGDWRFRFVQNIMRHGRLARASAIGELQTPDGDTFEFTDFMAPALFLNVAIAADAKANAIRAQLARSNLRRARGVDASVELQRSRLRRTQEQARVEAEGDEGGDEGGEREELADAQIGEAAAEGLELLAGAPRGVELAAEDGAVRARESGGLRDEDRRGRDRDERRARREACEAEHRAPEARDAR